MVEERDGIQEDISVVSGTLGKAFGFAEDTSPVPVPLTMR